MKIKRSRNKLKMVISVKNNIFHTPFVPVLHFVQYRNKFKKEW